MTGWAALRWLGGGWFGGERPDGVRLPVTLALGGVSPIKSQAGIQRSRERLRPDELVRHDGVVVTNAVRSVLFEMRYAASVRAAVQIADMAAYNDLVSHGELAEGAALLNGWTGIPQARKALPLCEENSWSPRESRTRLIWILDAGLPQPRCNVPVFDRSGNHLGTPDLLDEEAGLVVEYDGSVHLTDERRLVDESRDRGYRAAGLAVLLITRESGDARVIAEDMIRARASAAWEAESTRAWTTRPPLWWTDTTTVAARRALTAAERLRMLRLRLRADRDRTWLGTAPGTAPPAA